MRKPLRFPDAGYPLSVRIAVGRGELSEAFELVYERYLAKGYIDPRPGGMVYRNAFGLTSSRTIIATSPSRRLIGTLTVVGDCSLGLELETTYPSEVQSLREQGRSFAEITCLAICPRGDFPPTKVFFGLTRFMIHYAFWRRFDDLLMGVHPRHHRFYWRYFRAYPIGPCRPHACVRGSPSVLCRIDLHHLRQSVRPELWDQYFAEEVPEADFIRPSIDPLDHRHFLKRTGIMPHADLADHTGWGADAA